MNQNIASFPRRRLAPAIVLLITLVPALAGLMQAQSVPAARSSASLAEFLDEQTVIKGSAAAFQRQADASAEQLLPTAKSDGKFVTAKDEVEHARQLSRVAFQLADQRDFVTARRVALMAMAHLALERPLVAVTPALKAEAAELLGTLQEDVMGDWPAAMRAYQAALKQNSPRPLATARLARLQAWYERVNNGSRS
jgi:hypothetical protein